MDLSFDTEADDMPLQFAGFQRRPKLIHSVGAIAPAVWIPLENNYTGVFGGCKNILIRFSCATAPSTGPKGFTPGISVKCLRDGTTAANIFAMYSLEGQDSWNFFAHDLTNNVPDLSNSASFILHEIRRLFSAASEWPVMLGLSNWAAYDEQGNLVVEPKFPFRLIFHPVTAIHKAFPDTPSSTPFEELIADTLQPGPLYYVYAQDQPDDTQDKYIQIGSIELTAKPTTSTFGDNFMFYQHTRKEDDFVYYPHWIPLAEEILEEQQNTTYWRFPDLPWN